MDGNSLLLKMPNKSRNSIYAFTKEHESLVNAIHTLANVSLPNEILPNQTIKALWDTGATHTAISERLALKMQLPIEDFVRVSTATGILRVPVYLIRLGLPNDFIFEEVEAVEFSYTDEDDYDLIIGMDVMNQGDLSITNFEGKTLFSFRIPSMGRVDFESEDL
jgi:gag-polyprotein putative aspartyl protease